MQMAMRYLYDPSYLEGMLHEDANRFIAWILPEIIDDLRSMPKPYRLLEEWLRTHAFRFTYKDVLEYLNDDVEPGDDPDELDLFDDDAAIEIIEYMLDQGFVREINDERDPEPTGTYTLTRATYQSILRKMKNCSLPMEDWETFI